MLGDAGQPRDDGERERNHALLLVRGFAALVALSFGLIVLGALVRANGAGLACPDWPLCFGEFVPQMDLRVAFEWSHRVLAGGISMGFAVLALLTLRREPTRRVAGIGIGVAACLLGLQILLGALTVWMRLTAWTVTAHLLTGNAFALTLALIACALRDHGVVRPPRSRPTGAACGLVTTSAALLALQITLGGLVASRFAGLACPDWPSCSGGVWFPSWEGNVGLQLMHRLNGYALVAVLLAAAVASRNTPPLRTWTRVALGLGIAQVIVGVANVWLQIPIEVTGLHSALAAALVLSITLAARYAWPGPAAPAESRC